MASKYEDEYPDNPYERSRSRVKKPWYKKTGFWIIFAIVAVFLLLFMASITGNLPKINIGGNNNQTQTNTSSNATVQPTQEDRLVIYILDQQKAGAANDDIISKLRIAGYTDDQINSAFELTDPYVQYIIQNEKNGVEKTAIVDALLKSGLTAEQIQEKFAIVDKHQQTTNIFQKNWLLILIILAVIIFFVLRNKGEDTSNKLPKIFTLEECREYAEEKLKEKGYDFWPTKRYKNRPELKQYRYIFEEPVFPEFNNHKPYGHRSGGLPVYYCVAVGYDRELVEFHLTDSDMECREFLYGAPKGYESRANIEYLRMRQKSGMSVEELAALQRPANIVPGAYPGSPDQNAPYYQGRPVDKRNILRKRLSPGPIEGFERRE